MSMKKGLSLLVCLFFVFGLSACGRGLKMSPEVIDANINDVSFSTPATITEILDHDAIENYTIENAAYRITGFLVVSNPSGHLGIYSLIYGEMLVDFDSEIAYFDYRSVSYTGLYIEVHYTDNTTMVVDLNGITVLERDQYDSMAFSVTRYTHYDRDGNLFYTYVERREYVVTEGTVHQVHRYLINTESFERTPYDATDTEYQAGDFFDEGELPRIDLTPYGLKNHYLVVRQLTATVYNANNDKRVSAFMIPNNAYREIIFGGVYMYQTRQLVGDPELPYTYTANNNQYLLRTYTIDLKTGKHEQIDFPYLITSASTFADEDGIYTYARARLYPIKEKHLDETYLYDVVLDDEGDIVLDITSYNIGNKVRLNSETILDSSAREFYDNEMNFIFALPTPSVSYIYHEDLLIYQHDGLYGLLDYRGTILVPFEFSNIDSSFYGGETVGHKQDGSVYIIGKDNSQTELDAISNYQVLIPGILRGSQYNLTNMNYDIQLIHYGHGTMDIFAEHAMDTLLIFEHWNVSTIFYTTRIIVVQHTEGTAYYTVILDD